ncbi:LppP/LprE family lipoprotein [Tsukamurella sp. 8F]|uniref:LppP/LprE family lipoprotein n=1 Tax=unclassified Tsukamurella TaxID=2633480 RepID=UPI0023B89C76|nr:MULTISPECIES: LppP/LprE family lipoprotein [unclassified Tsukamurella]MDF0530269.1 LppP/LprE family lipoprotein [Tsukamurella sp. 8J]MDF0588587.1 LppP/LprE family lipoprotein [Tsukamurella sp. 8F]
MRIRSALLAPALVAAGVAALPATATATPSSCPQLPSDRVADAVNSLPRAFPDRAWVVTAHGASKDCTLNWIQVFPQGSTGSSPTQVLFFDHMKYSSVATPRTGFTTVVDSAAPDQVTVRFRWIAGDEPNADPQGHADVRYVSGPQGPVHPIDPIPPQVTQR